MGGTRQDTYQRRSKALVVPPLPKPPLHYCTLWHLPLTILLLCIRTQYV